MYRCIPTRLWLVTVDYFISVKQRETSVLGRRNTSMVSRMGTYRSQLCMRILRLNLAITSGFIDPKSSPRKTDIFLELFAGHIKTS